MKNFKTISIIASLAMAMTLACQNKDYTEPANATSTAVTASSTTVYSLATSTTTKYLDASLKETNASKAVWVLSNGTMVPNQSYNNIGNTYTYPTTTGTDADLKTTGVGFGLMTNSQYGTTKTWTDGGFKSVYEISFIFKTTGDAIKICRSAATTCVTVTATASTTATVSATMAANSPDVDLGTLSATGPVVGKILGSGAAGLTLANNLLTAGKTATTNAFGTANTLKWTLSQGSVKNGSMKVKIEVNGTEILAETETDTSLTAAYTDTTNCLGLGAGVGCVSAKYSATLGNIAVSPITFNGVNHGMPLMIKAGGSLGTTLANADFTVPGGGSATDGTDVNVFLADAATDVADATGGGAALSAATGSAANAKALIRGAISAIYNGFYAAAFGPGTAASNFSVKLTNAAACSSSTSCDRSTTTPSITGITITTQ